MCVREMKIDGNIRICPEELGQQRSHPASAEGKRRGELYQAAWSARGLTGEILRLLGVGVDCRCSLSERAAVVRECKSSGCPVEQSTSQPFLEAGNGPRDRGDRDSHGCCSPSERTFFGDLREH